MLRPLPEAAEGSRLVPVEVSASLAEELGLGEAMAGGEDAGGGKGAHRGTFSEGAAAFGAGRGGDIGSCGLRRATMVFHFPFLANRRERPKLEVSGWAAREQHTSGLRWSSALPGYHKEGKRQGRSPQSSPGRGEETWEVQGWGEPG